MPQFILLTLSASRTRRNAENPAKMTMTGAGMSVRKRYGTFLANNLPGTSVFDHVQHVRTKQRIFSSVPYNNTATNFLTPHSLSCVLTRDPPV